jgi:glucokinase
LNDKSIIVLAGDVGGTKTLLALFECRNSRMVELYSKKYKSHDFANLEMVVKDFLTHQNIKPQIAVFGIPGPVDNGKAKSTNLPWVVD